MRGDAVKKTGAQTIIRHVFFTDGKRYLCGLTPQNDPACPTVINWPHNFLARSFFFPRRAIRTNASIIIIMVNMEHIGYDSVSRVLETWEKARRTGKDFEKDFGKLLIDKFVELQPRSKKFYQGPEMMQKHSDGIVHLFDSILQMLGA